jgi:hypothetical protein
MDCTEMDTCGPRRPSVLDQKRAHYLLKKKKHEALLAAREEKTRLYQFYQKKLFGY